MQDSENSKYLICTMEHGTDLCKIEMYGRREYKYPTLQELFRYCFFQNVKSFGMPKVLHSADYDASITAKCFFRMMDIDSGFRSMVNRNLK